MLSADGERVLTASNRKSDRRVPDTEVTSRRCSDIGHAPRRLSFSLLFVHHTSLGFLGGLVVHAWPWSYDHRASHPYNTDMKRVSFSPTR